MDCFWWLRVDGFLKRPNFVARIYQISTLPLHAVCAFSGLDNDGLKNYHADSRPAPKTHRLSEWINPLFTWTRLPRVPFLSDSHQHTHERYHVCHDHHVRGLLREGPRRHQGLRQGSFPRRASHAPMPRRATPASELFRSRKRRRNAGPVADPPSPVPTSGCVRRPRQGVQGLRLLRQGGPPHRCRRHVRRHRRHHREDEGSYRECSPATLFFLGFRFRATRPPASDHARDRDAARDRENGRTRRVCAHASSRRVRRASRRAGRARLVPHARLMRTRPPNPNPQTLKKALLSDSRLARDDGPNDRTITRRHAMY